MADPLTWIVKTDEVGTDGLDLARAADAAELRGLSAALGIPDVEALSVDVRVVPTGHNGRFRMTGALEARVTQTCVVTLEPVAQAISEPIEVDLWPADEIGPLAAGEHSVLEADMPEPIENGRIGVGRIAYEHLAAALDPYPRRSDAAFEGRAQGPRGSGDVPASPFAVLAGLKPKPAGGGGNP